MYTILYKILNYKESSLKISKDRYEIQQKFSKTMNISIQLLKYHTHFLKSITKHMKKYTKKIKYFIHNL